MKQVQTLKGFRDFLPQEARKRQFMISHLKEVFESFGFEPLETPAIEYEDILLGKYGEEGDKLMYRFVDNGGRNVALRYDQTVPLSRVAAQYGPVGTQELQLPFKRYQIQPVWRAENTQKGRFREFLQCDIDVVGSTSTLSDAEVIAVADASLKKLGFEKFKILINDRSVLSTFSMEEIRIIDKLKKIGIDSVANEMAEKKLVQTVEEAQEKVEKLRNETAPERLQEIFKIAQTLDVDKETLVFEPTLARGLDYYTGLIFEIEIEGYTAGSVCGGGRYDKLIGMFLPKDKPQLPAVGFAFGFDRLVEAMEALSLFPQELNTTKVLVTIFSPELLQQSLEVSSRLREIPDGTSQSSNNINVELYLDETAKMEKQLKYAEKKGIPYVIILGPEEIKKGMVKVKNMKTREQKEVELSKLSGYFI